jgi:hypothetical protein
MTPPIITIPQDRETEASVELIPGGGGKTIALNYVYARSRDTRKANALGQDFIAYRWDDKRIAFAICDGVSQSFYGEIAARFLGVRLVKALWAGQGKHLSDHLQRWVEDGNREVQNKVIGAHLPEMQRVALERKREQGSESMFIAGLVEFGGKGKHKGQFSIYYMGDMRVWLWDANAQEIPIPGAKFETRERWSSKIGLKNGDLNTITMPLDKVARITAHSDGVGSFGPKLNAIAQDFLNTVVEEQNAAPASDDISVFDINFRYEDIFGEVVTIPPPVPSRTSEHEPVLVWDRTWLATRYRIAVDDGHAPYTDEIEALIKVEGENPHQFTYTVRLPENGTAVCRVQALNDYAYPSQWSEPVTVTAEPLKEPVQAKAPSTPKTQKKSRASALLTVVVSVLLLVFLITAAWVALIVLNWNALTATP